MPHVSMACSTPRNQTAHSSTQHHYPHSTSSYIPVPRQAQHNGLFCTDNMPLANHHMMCSGNNSSWDPNADANCRHQHGCRRLHLPPAPSLQSKLCCAMLKCTRMLPPHHGFSKEPPPQQCTHLLRPFSSAHLPRPFSPNTQRQTVTQSCFLQQNTCAPAVSSAGSPLLCQPTYQKPKPFCIVTRCPDLPFLSACASAG